MAALPLAIAGLLLAAAPVPPSGADLPFTPGLPASYELAGGQEHVHVIALEASQFLRLAVVQQGIDVVVMLAGPDGSGREVDVVAGHFGREPASLAAAVAGRYRVAVRARDEAAARGRYLLESESLRPAEDRDRARAMGENALAEGARLARAGTAETRRAAFPRFGEALGAWRALEDRDWEAETRLAAGLARAAGGEQAPAMEHAAAALAWFRAGGDRAGEGRALHLAGQIHYHQSQYGPAFEHWDQALALRRELGDGWGTAETLTSLALAHAERSRTDKGLQLGQEALELWRAVGDRRGEGRALSHLGEIQAHGHEMQAAVDLFMQALPLQQAAGDRSGEAGSLANLGFMRQALGDTRGSLEYFKRVLPLWRELGDRRGEASTLNNMGYAHIQLEEPDEALKCYEQALHLWRETGDRGRQAFALVNLGHLFVKRGEPERALANHAEALRTFREMGDRSSEALTLLNLGNSYAAAGRREEARRHYQEALELKRELGDRLGQAVAHYSAARVDSDAGELDRARTALEEALDIMEAERRRVSTLTLPVAHGASVPEMYELYVDVLMGLHGRQPAAGFAERALHASERARARALLELLHEARAETRQGMDPALIEEERIQQDRLSRGVEEQVRLLAGRHTAEQAGDAALAVQALTMEVEGARARLRAASPRYAALDQPDLLTAARIRQELLDDDTLLLEYALGGKRSFLWVVGRASFAAYELPSRTVIEEAARKAYEQLSRRRPGPGTAAALAGFSRMILGPAADTLSARRLLVVPDGALNYIPFAALPDPKGGEAPILALHEVVAAPSASVLAALRRERGGRMPAPKALAMLADPVFGRSDPRLGPVAAGASRAKGQAGRGTGDQDLERATRDVGLSGALSRLPFTRREANAVLALVPPAQRKGALDFEASRATATGGSLEQYRVVHFATHGFLNSARPELSGIVLSLVNAEGKDERGFITTADVFNLRLAAELVVLSGCRTALGREIKGEGLVGLTRGFMYAGASRIVASLWKVDDEATAALMTRFYREMLGPARRPPAAALRAAQASLRRERRWREPYYWAAFQLQGEWN